MTARDDVICEVEDVAVLYPIRRGFLQRTVGHVRAVENASFRLRRGETLAIVGESGCGKSTLARAILGLERPTSGRIRLESRRPDRGGRKVHRSEIAQVVFQDPLASLDPRWRVEDIIAEGLDAHGLAKGDARRDRVLALLADVDLPPDFLWKYPHELSGGQQQRVAIARALATNPEMIVLDEATSALDVSVQAQILNLLGDLQVEHGLTYLFISHDLSVVAQFADRVAVMYLGRVMELGPVATVMNAAWHPYTSALLQATLPVEPDFDIEDMKSVTGDVPSPSNPPSGCRFRTRCPNAGSGCADLDYAVRPLDEAEHYAADCLCPARPAAAGAA